MISHMAETKPMAVGAPAGVRRVLVAAGVGALVTCATWVVLWMALHF